MRSVMTLGLTLTAVLLAGCGAPPTDRPEALTSSVSPVQPPAIPEGSAQGDCLDQDGDGFGAWCRRGADCDDHDPLVTDICYRCLVAAEGCSCLEQADPRPCDVDTNGPPNDRTCWLGQRNCVDGVWAHCVAYAPRFR